MTMRERLMALDAAVVAVENCHPHKDLSAAISILQDELDKYFDSISKPENFEDFLILQKKAVKKLANCPSVFGA